MNLWKTIRVHNPPPQCHWPGSLGNKSFFFKGSFPIIIPFLRISFSTLFLGDGFHPEKIFHSFKPRRYSGLVFQQWPHLRWVRCGELGVGSEGNFYRLRWGALKKCRFSTPDMRKWCNLTNSFFFSSWVETETINYIDYIDVVGDLQNKFFPKCKWQLKIGRRIQHNLSSLKRRILRWNCPMNRLEMSWSFHDRQSMITWGEKLLKSSREVWALVKKHGFVESDCSDHHYKQWHSHVDVWVVKGNLQP